MTGYMQDSITIRIVICMMPVIRPYAQGPVTATTTDRLLS